MINLEDITIYHKKYTSWVIYNIRASFRNTSVINRNKDGITNKDKALIRIFETDTYKTRWNCQKLDVIVRGKISNIIEKQPLMELQKIYGTGRVFQIQSIDENIFGEELDHVKIGAL